MSLRRVPLASFTVHVYGPEGKDASDAALAGYEGHRVPRWVRRELSEHLRGDSGLTVAVVLDDEWACVECGGYHPDRSCGGAT